ncbi:MAG: CPBP family intramembrane glutamic endopeptidase, partial [Erysipelotrichaceae bacterium]|nr:CPBP family intramembrane glutamic endopeptidase [Erysipelotrichaceae bacterium]
QLLSAVVQSLVAISLGAVFTVIYYRGGNLWALMLLHSIMDLGPLFESMFTVNEAGAAGAINTLSIMNLIPIIPNVIALVWIMRKSKAQEALVYMRKRYETL